MRMILTLATAMLFPVISASAPKKMIDNKALESICIAREYAAAGMEYISKAGDMIDKEFRLGSTDIAQDQWQEFIVPALDKGVEYVDKANTVLDSLLPERPSRKWNKSLINNIYSECHFQWSVSANALRKADFYQSEYILALGGYSCFTEMYLAIVRNKYLSIFRGIEYIDCVLDDLYDAYALDENTLVGRIRCCGIPLGTVQKDFGKALKMQGFRPVQSTEDTDITGRKVQFNEYYGRWGEYRSSISLTSSKISGRVTSSRMIISDIVDSDEAREVSETIVADEASRYLCEKETLDLGRVHLRIFSNEEDMASGRTMGLITIEASLTFGFDGYQITVSYYDHQSGRGA